MAEISLRDYQEKQYNFIDWKLEISNTVGVESRRGAGMGSGRRVDRHTRTVGL